MFWLYMYVVSSVNGGQTLTGVVFPHLGDGVIKYEYQQ